MATSTADTLAADLPIGLTATVRSRCNRVLTHLRNGFIGPREAEAELAEAVSTDPALAPVLPGQTWEPEGEGDFVEYVPAADAWAGDPDRMTRRETYAL